MSEVGVFSEFGLTDGEGKVLDALIGQGPSTGTKIASKIGINKSVAYFVLDQLVQKGFASFIVINKKREYRALDSKMLSLKLEERKKDFLKKYSDISSVLALAAKKKKKNTLVNIFSDWKGIRTAFEDIIISTKKGEEYLVFSVNVPDTIAPRFRRFIQKIQEARAEKGIICNILVDERLKSTIGEDRKKEKFTNVRFVSAENSMPLTVNVYANKVLFVIWGEVPVAIVMESNEVNESFRSFFYLLWKKAKVV